MTKNSGADVSVNDQWFDAETNKIERLQQSVTQIPGSSKQSNHHNPMIPEDPEDNVSFVRGGVGSRLDRSQEEVRIGDTGYHQSVNGSTSLRGSQTYIRGND